MSDTDVNRYREDWPLGGPSIRFCQFVWWDRERSNGNARKHAQHTCISPTLARYYKDLSMR